MKKFFSMLLAMVMVVSISSVTAFAAESNTSTDNTNAQEQVIGEYDGLLSDCYTGNALLAASVANVRINSYATYDKNDGITVTVKLYVPWYEFPKPQFTGMIGSVLVTLSNSGTQKSFAEIANGDETISTDVDTGVKGNSGDQATVSVSGVATALNALGGGGVFAISYPVTIP